MTDQSHRSLLKTLEDEGDLIRIDKEVDPLTNMATVKCKAFSKLGKASLFTNIKEHKGWQGCSQILADRRRWALGLGIKEDDLLDTITQRFNHPVQTVEVNRDKAPVKEVVLSGNEVDLFDIPSMITSEKDGGRYFASGLAIVKDAETGVRNISVHQQQVVVALGIAVATKNHLRNVEGGLDLLDVKTVDSAGVMMLVIKLRPKFEGQSKTALMAALSGPYLHSKIAIALDDDIDAWDRLRITIITGGGLSARGSP